MTLILPGLVVSPARAVQITRAKTATQSTKSISNQPGLAGTVMNPDSLPVTTYATVNVAQQAQQEALDPSVLEAPGELKPIPQPKGAPPEPNGVPIVLSEESSLQADEALAPVPATTGLSPAPSKTFKGQELIGGAIPPDTHGAVGTNHVVTVTNDRMRIFTRDGVVLSTVTMSSFWTGMTLEGGATVSAFDTKVFFDRFNNRYILESSANAQSLSSAVLLAVSQTSDPTGTWNRYSVDADPTATAATGKWIDYPSVGFNKNWIVINENEFNYGSAGGGYWGPAIFVFDKQAAYAGTLSSIPVFQAANTTCTLGTEFSCGFTMAPTVVEDNTTESMYTVENWNSTSAQLRINKITGTPSAPVLTVGTQFPQGTRSWRFNAAVIGTSGGYALQRQQIAFLVSGTRPANNDARMQNAVLRNGKLWCAQTVMLPTVPTAAGVSPSTAANPDDHSGIQWWQIDPTDETASAIPALQFARVEDPTADNCHNGSGGLRTAASTPPCPVAQGQFFAFPNITVNQNDDALIGYTRFSNLTYPSAAYSFRASADPVNTTRDSVVFRSGQANYNIGGGSPFTVRWGDYSAAQTDPLNDTDFWTTQEYSDTQRDVGIGINGTWGTWWAMVKPTAPAAPTTGSLIISEFRLRGPSGVRDEYVELYNPGTSPLTVTTTDGSDGWSLAYSPNGTTVVALTTIPVGTVIPAGGHYLITSNLANGLTAGTVYSLTTAPNTQVRDSGGDTGYVASADNADNGGFAIFKTSNTANFTVATRMDSAGFNSIAAGLFKEGNGIPAVTATAPTGQIAFYRNLVSGTPQDTNANENDFVFVDTAATTESFGVQPKLGSAAPKNLDSPIQRFAQFPIENVDRNKTNAQDPNRVRDVNPYTDTLTPTTVGGTYTLGTLSIRKNVGNNSGVPATRLRFRIVDMTTFPSPVGTADMRALTSPAITVTSTDAGMCAPAAAPCSLSVQGLTLEQPPTQGSGGGLNSTLSAGTITLATPLPPLGAINVNFLLGVRQSGSFRFFITVEALP